MTPRELQTQRKQLATNLLDRVHTRFTLEEGHRIRQIARDMGISAAELVREATLKVIHDDGFLGRA